MLGDGSGCPVLQDVSMASLLPPAGKEIFRRFTPASLEELQLCFEEEEREKLRRKEKNIEV